MNKYLLYIFSYNFFLSKYEWNDWNLFNYEFK